MSTRHAVRIALVAALAAASLTASTAKPEATAVAEVALGTQSVKWAPLVPYERLVLTVSGPDIDWSREFGRGEAPVFELGELPGGGADGTYVWELRRVPELAAETRERLAAAREASDRGIAVDTAGLGLPAGPFSQSGEFGVLGGAVVRPDETEPRPEADARRAEPLRFEGDVEVTGDLKVRGTKAFLSADPQAPGASIVYVALEGPEAGTYLRGSARTEGGVAVIELPRHFAEVTEAEGLTVQLTPRGGWSRLYVAERSLRRIVVRAEAGGDGIEFDYLIQGVRRGFAGHRVRQPAAATERR